MKKFLHIECLCQVHHYLIKDIIFKFKYQVFFLVNKNLTTSAFSSSIEIYNKLQDIDEVSKDEYFTGKDDDDDNHDEEIQITSDDKNDYVYSNKLISN